MITVETYSENPTFIVILGVSGKIMFLLDKLIYILEVAHRLEVLTSILIQTVQSLAWLIKAWSSDEPNSL